MLLEGTSASPKSDEAPQIVSAQIAPFEALATVFTCTGAASDNFKLPMAFWQSYMHLSLTSVREWFDMRQNVSVHNDETDKERLTNVTIVCGVYHSTILAKYSPHRLRPIRTANKPHRVQELSSRKSRCESGASTGQKLVQ